MSFILFIGDIHIKFNNLIHLSVLEHKIKSMPIPKFIVLGGDVLDSHERINTQLMNKAYELINCLRNIAPVYILVGNHDYINNQQFLSTQHWMNAMKEWSNVTIVDTVVVKDDYVFVPFVPVGRLLEALNTIGNAWKQKRCIFAHQEIKHCKMGSIVSLQGDDWQPEWPMLISGHIHEQQHVGNNVFYPGSAFNNAYAKDHQGVCKIFVDTFNLTFEHVDLELVKKKILYQDLNTITLEFLKKLSQDTKLSLTGTSENIQSFKKTKEFKYLTDRNIKLVFRIKTSEQPKILSRKLFLDVLIDLIENEKDIELKKDYNTIQK
jgi:DNA repair exonuclease SbcCD nuclease subunit